MRKLTAEEWKRRYEKERDKNARLKALLERYESELLRWRGGESVPESEQASKQSSKELVASDSTHNLAAETTAPRASGGSTMSDEERMQWEVEKQALYQQLDDKVGLTIHIHKTTTATKINNGGGQWEKKEKFASFFFHLFHPGWWDKQSVPAGGETQWPDARAGKSWLRPHAVTMRPCRERCSASRERMTPPRTKSRRCCKPSRNWPWTMTRSPWKRRARQRRMKASVRNYRRSWLVWPISLG